MRWKKDRGVFQSLSGFLMVATDAGLLPRSPIMGFQSLSGFLMVATHTPKIGSRGPSMVFQSLSGFLMVATRGL